jgi:hypothetical protein
MSQRNFENCSARDLAEQCGEVRLWRGRTRVQLRAGQSSSPAPCPVAASRRCRRAVACSVSLHASKLQRYCALVSNTLQLPDGTDDRVEETYPAVLTVGSQSALLGARCKKTQRGRRDSNVAGRWSETSLCDARGEATHSCGHSAMPRPPWVYWYSHRQAARNRP